jgi:hypothetical protein
LEVVLKRKPLEIFARNQIGELKFILPYEFENSLNATKMIDTIRLMKKRGDLPERVSCIIGLITPNPGAENEIHAYKFVPVEEV